MKRNIDARIEKWLSESDKALLLYGARQVGKTYAITKKAFSKSTFSKTLTF